MNSSRATVTFSEQDLEQFAAASGDCNPLHMSLPYAQRSAYGQRVVFGALGAVALLGAAGPRGKSVVRLAADFLRPMFLGVPYAVEGGADGQSWTGRLMDGSVPVVSIHAELSAATSMDRPAAPVFERAEPAEPPEREFRPGAERSGRYAPDPAALDLLLNRWGLEAGHSQAVALLAFASYFAGMELPGREGLFSKLQLSLRPPVAPGLFDYRAEVRSFDQRFRRLRTSVVLRSGSDEVAAGELECFVRPPLAQDDADYPVSTDLAGKVALVTGASRGLGLALKRALASRGATVIGVSRTTDLAGDAGDPAFLEQVRANIMREHGRLDHLICNACPSILPLRLEPAGLLRIEEYISHAISMVAAPFCTFLDVLNSSGGCAVVVSSSAVRRPVREWPHYLAAKNAVEALARVAPLQYPRVGALIVRPEKLMTEMTNTPMGRLGAQPPSQAALQIVDRISRGIQAGTTDVWE